MHLRAAANYIQSGHFEEALNVLDGIKERRALWYFTVRRQIPELEIM